MKLVIHDLSEEKWQEIADQYQDATVISDNGSIRPCVGCFGCWNKQPGECVVKDGYENMGYLIHHADEVIVISRYTYGGLSGFVKNVFDRSLAYVLPHFEIVNGQSHHKKRYEEQKPYSYIFYGTNITDVDKENAIRYVNAVSVNMRTYVKDVQFVETDEEENEKTVIEENRTDKLIVLNASMRTKDGNGAKLAVELQKKLKTRSKIVNLSAYLNKSDELIENLLSYSRIVLCMPLYVDGLPSQMIRLMEKMEKGYRAHDKKIYVLANMGLYESEQLINLFTAVKRWCEIMDFAYSGGLGIASGELVGGFLDFSRLDKWPLRQIYKGMNDFASAIDDDKVIDDIYTGTYSFPRWLYIAIANSGWKRMGKANGITEKDLYRRL